jgi:putative secretion ATPase (PEP-CTERM system associated)
MFDEFYGFSGQPFQLNPDPAFFYGSRGHKRAYAYLQYGLYQGEGFIALTGEVGAGKTTLIRSLLQELSAKNVVAAQLVSTQLDADSLLRAVATAFGLAVREHDKARILAELEAYLVSLVPQNERALLIVDEAQNLTPRAMEELRMLSNFQLQNRALLQSFLVGQPELRQLMRSPGMRQLRQRVIASYHLGPLDSDETRAYIEHRLKQVGWQGDPAFEEEVFAVVHAYTGGIPRRINTVCTRALLAAFLSEKHLIAVEDMEQVMGELAEELGESAGAAASADGADDPAGLEERISGVEKAMAMTVKLLREVIRARERSEPDPPEKAP